MTSRTFGIAAAIVALALGAAMVLANGTSGDRVLGQLNFTHATPNLVDAIGLANPVAVAIDTSTSPNHHLRSRFRQRAGAGLERRCIIRQWRTGGPGDRPAGFPVVGMYSLHRRQHLRLQPDHRRYSLQSVGSRGG